MVNSARNFRWNYIRSGYLICLMRDEKDDWFLLSTPKRSHKGLSVTAVITCQHVCAQLNKKNLYLTFDDENGIGTVEYLLRQVLENTGWQLGYCETFYEQDGKTEKVRSLSSDGKRGAYLLISDICALFDARPVFDGDSRTVSVYSLNRHEDLLELNFGKNLNGIDRKEDAENIVTRLYVEGDYGDDGYVGIEDVNPTGLPFLLDFSYFRELGVFTAEHEQALDDYLRDIQAAKAGSSNYSKELIQLDNQLNELWGQIDYVLYTLNQGAITKTICGGAATEDHTAITATDTLTVLMKDGTHHTQTGNTFPNDAEYAIKFIKKASGRIGGKEVAIEAKESSIASLQKQLDKTTDEAKRQGLQEQITALELGIQSIYQDDGGEDGLYTLMRKAVQLVLQRTEIEKSYLSSMDSQQEIEKRFAEAMGEMLIDGYWSNTAYAPGQEELLYYEALGVMERLAKPTVTYTVDVQNLSGVSGYEQERFTLDTALHIWDEALE